MIKFIRKKCFKPTRSRPARQRRGVALVMVLGALTILTVMLTEFQDETSAEFGSTLSTRDAIKAEYAARSAINLSRLLIAAEPTIRKAIAPLFLLMKRGPPQIPVWEFSNQVLGAFNDETGRQLFSGLAGVDVAEGKNLGLEGAGFELTIVDEDSKINLNIAARGDAFSQARLATELIGLMSGPQFNPLFENRDADGQFSDRQTICSAIVDWVDPDQDSYVCDPHSGTAQQTAAEDSFYQLLPDPYPRRNAAFDSLEELRLVRGVGDDFWATFVDPDSLDPARRTLTVWGQGKVNVNTANAQTILAIVCGGAPSAQICNNPEEAAKFLSALSLVRSFTVGAPLFSSPKGFINAMGGRGMFGTVLKMLELEPIQFLSANETMKAVTTESKVFSVIATGIVKAGKRETRVRIHSVIDFRGAPPPGLPPDLTNPNDPNSGGLANALAGRGTTSAAGPASNLPEGATEEAILATFRPSPGGRIVYYRIE